MTWNKIVESYQHDLGLNPRILYKVTDSHVYLSSFGKMKVNYATQVLSRSIAIAVKKKFQEDTSELIAFIEIVNKYFDMNNVRYVKEGIHKRNPNLLPYYSASDHRLKVTIITNVYINSTLSITLILAFCSGWRKNLSST